MDIGEEQPPIELPLPVTPEKVLPEQEEHPQRSLPAEQPAPENVPA